MIYQEILPQLSLQRYISCYWMLKSDVNTSADFHRIFPDGCTDIIFNFADPLVSKVGCELEVNSFRSFIVGSMTRTVLSSTQKCYDLLGVRFKPGGMQHWVRTPIGEFTDAVADCDEDTPFQFWYEQLCEHTLIHDRIAHLNNLLVESINHNPLQRSLEVALFKLTYTKGTCRISELTKEIGVSERQLERNFKQRVGLTPKQFARVIQFQHMTSLLQEKGEDSLLQLATDGGYTDHAHFTKSFREFSGITPQEFLNRH